MRFVGAVFCASENYGARVIAQIGTLLVVWSSNDFGNGGHNLESFGAPAMFLHCVSGENLLPFSPPAGKLEPTNKILISD
jgi:hypothetical protein